MKTLGHFLLWLKLKWVFRGTGVSIEVSDYNPSEPKKLIDNASKMFCSIARGGTTLEYRAKAIEELNFMKAALEYFDDFSVGEEDKKYLHFELEAVIILGEDVLEKTKNTFGLAEVNVGKVWNYINDTYSPTLSAMMGKDIPVDLDYLKEAKAFFLNLKLNMNEVLKLNGECEGDISSFVDDCLKTIDDLENGRFPFHGDNVRR